MSTTKTIVVGDPSVDETIRSRVSALRGSTQIVAEESQAISGLLSSRAKGEGAQNLDAVGLGKSKAELLRAQASLYRAQAAISDALGTVESYATDRYTQSPHRG